MARDFFSDIPDEELTSARSEERAKAPPPQDMPAPARSIRNIAVPQRRQPSALPKVGTNDIRRDQPLSIAEPHLASPRRARMWVWIAAGVSVFILAGAVLLVMWSDTTVTVTPRAYRATFEPTTQFTALPQGSAPEGAIAYAVVTNTFDESTTVAATGVEKAEDRATGTITVFNEYSASAVRLIKNTRFESPSGLIFRIPASVEVPGMKGATPGQVTITVFADQAGPAYNLGPTDRFTVPGLKSSPDMYQKVYARSNAAFSGGFIGERAAVPAQALETARSELRGRLAEKAKEAAGAITDGFAFSDLMRITYESLPTTSDPSGGARVNERAVVYIPVFPERAFAQAVARAVSADASESAVSLLPQSGFSAKPAGNMPENLGEAPVLFVLEGSALIVWDVDARAIAEALRGREQEAFETIIATFAGVEKAQARVAPFWSSRFPTNADDIIVVITAPA